MPSQVVSDGNLAFMPTSNDALYPNGSLQSPRAPSADSLRGSPSRIPLPPDSLDGMTSPLSLSGVPSNGLRSRDHVMSASTIPPNLTPITAPSTAKTDDWHAMYNQVISLHDNERDIWKMERQKLTEEIDRLRQEVSRLTSSSSRHNSVISEAAGGKENGGNGVFYNPIIVKQANEKLKQISQVSPGSGTPTGDEQPPPLLTGGLSRRTSVQKRLPRITENNEPSSNSPVKNVGFSLGVTGPGDGSFPVTLDEQEGPYSPPTTAHADILSPPPENFVRHAGHTPLRPRSQHGQEEEQKPQFVPAGIGMEEDRELSSPKVLAKTPEGDLSTLSLLEKRLQSIAENPDDPEHQPDAIRAAALAEQASAPAAAPEDGGIKLKTRRSMNFGAPLGQR